MAYIRGGKYYGATLLAAGMALSACTNPLRIGPGRLAITLDDAKVVTISRGAILGKDVREPDRLVRVVRLDISTQKNVFEYFEDWHRPLHTECVVDGAKDGHTYVDFALGPFQNGIDISEYGTRRLEAKTISSGADSKFRYTAFAFIDLKASDSEYRNGTPAGYLSLEAQEFSEIRCRFIGRGMNLFFIRSNDVTVNEQNFRSLITSAAQPGLQRDGQ